MVGHTVKGLSSRSLAPTLTGGNGGIGGFFNNISTNLSTSISSVIPTKNVPARMALIVLLLVVIAAISYYFYIFLSNKFKVGYKENSEHIPINGTSSNECEILLFGTTWCPHCKAAKPIWEEVKIEYTGKTVNGYTIVFTEVDCTNETPETEKMMNRYKIDGFPTVKLLKNGQIIEFDAKVTKANLEKFLNTAV
jgi:thiol-disulfide isomerase/thioredoxin